MTYLSFATLIEHRVPLTAAEAVTLTLAAARLLDVHRIERYDVQLPPDHCLLLSNTGQVTLSTVEARTEQDEITALAGLLRRLLRLDEPGGAESRAPVPGGLMVLLARVAGEIDLARPTGEEFRAALARFMGDADMPEAVLSAVFWRAASLRPGSARTERRRRGLSRAELRRALRDVERELYERSMAHVAPKVTRQPRAAVAAGLIGAMLVAMLAGSGMLDRVPPAAEPVLALLPSSRPDFIAESAPRSIPIVTRSQIGREAFSPSFGPTGRAIYFHAGGAAAPLMRASMDDNGGVESVTKVLDDGASNQHVTLSADGSMMAFDSDRDGVRGVYVADADGRSARRISGGGYAAIPSWSPDGRRLAFVRAEPRRPRVWNVWIADIADGTLTRVTRHATGQPLGASWFPDGQRLAYSRAQQLVIVDLRNRRSTIVASPMAGHLVRTPAVSPDGSRVVFQVQGDGAWMLDVTRMRLRRILPDPSAEEFVWSPNGRTIAYQARSQDGYGLWRMSL